MHPLKQYLADLQESVTDFSVRVGASRQTLYRIINGRQSPKPALARRIVEATGGAVTLNDLFACADGETTILPWQGEHAESELDNHRLKLALAIVFNHLTAADAPAPPSRSVAIAAEAASNTYTALRPVTTRQGPARLTQALRPVLEEILRECADPVPPQSAIDRGAQLATDLYYQTWAFERRT